jgi:hypothetical protein
LSLVEDGGTTAPTASSSSINPFRCTGKYHGEENNNNLSVLRQID